MIRPILILLFVFTTNVLALNPDGKIGGIGIHALPSYTKYLHDKRPYYWDSKTQQGYNGSYSLTVPFSDHFTGAFSYKMQRIEDHSILHSFLLSNSIYFKSDSILSNPDGATGSPIISSVIGMNAFIGRKGIVAGLDIGLPISSLLTLSMDYMLNRLSDESSNSVGGGLNIHLFNNNVSSPNDNPDGSPGSINIQLRSHYLKAGVIKGMDIITVLQIPIPLLPMTFNASYQHIRQHFAGELLERSNTFGLGLSIYL